MPVRGLRVLQVGPKASSMAAARVRTISSSSTTKTVSRRPLSASGSGAVPAGGDGRSSWWAAEIGNKRRTVVPTPGDERSSIDPPSAASRSAMFVSPDPRGIVAGSNPRPSSVTANDSVPSDERSSIRTAAASAYFDAFCNASNEQKYTAASTS